MLKAGSPTGELTQPRAPAHGFEFDTEFVKN